MRPIPEFKSEDEEREFWATHDSTDYVDWSKARRLVLPNLKPKDFASHAHLPIDFFKRLVEAALRPKCRIIELAVFRDHPEAGLADEPFQDISEIQPPSWITVYYELEEISTGQTASGAVNMYVDEDGHAMEILGLDLVVGPFERDFAGAIVDSLLAAVEYYEIARA